MHQQNWLVKGNLFFHRGFFACLFSRQFQPCLSSLKEKSHPTSMLSCFICVRLFAALTDCYPPGASAHGILKARILEWVAISFSDVLKAVSLKEEISQSVQSLSRVRFFATPRTAAHQASLSITNSWNPPKPMSIVLVMPSTISSSVVPFSSCPQSFPASGSFQMS